MNEQSSKSMSRWLLMVAAGIAVMMVIGAITRLTESGLSMTEWSLIGGTPPMNEADWETLFKKYQGTPQHLITFPDMDLEGFKRIFWWEYIHRMFGRGLGLLFAIPLLWFAVRRRISWTFGGVLLLALVLGAGQGLLGWYMVRSGLDDLPWVSPVRLTAHLLLAFALFVYILGLALVLRWRGAPSPGLPPRQRTWLGVGTVLLALQLALGGMMSGMRAALDYPSFPTMNGQWIPDMLWRPELGWMNGIENPTLIHFSHRLMAVAVLVVLGSLAWKWYSSADKALRFLAAGMLGTLIVQFALGILTVLQARGEVPEALGVLHQVGAILLVAAVVGCWARQGAETMGRIVCG